MSRVPASPHLLQPVERTFITALVSLALLALVFPAPLEVAADPSSPPNPAKSAWFLLWIQELISYHTSFVYAGVALALTLVVLPWLGKRPVDRAVWFRREHALESVLSLLGFLTVLALTVIGLFFRGTDWCFVVPF